MSKAIILCLSFCCLLTQWECRDKYVSPYKSPVTGYLVVEGYISGNTPTQFTLNRTIPLPGDSAIPAELEALVQVEGSDNSTYPLAEQGNGLYSSVNTLTLNTATQYRLRIHTSNGEDYLSDLVPFKVTPPIDSISWLNSSNGVGIYANAHDPANNTHYYQWDYDQTYEYHSAEASLYYYDTDTLPHQFLPRPDSLEGYRCWMSGSSSDILVGSSVKLAQDVIYRQLLKSIPPDDIQLSVLYSILVRQYALTEDGYNFLSLMRQNTESLGSVFDAQPSQTTGNIHCLTYASERVIGYISAGTVQQQRIFISKDQVSNNYSYTCPVRDTMVNNPPTDFDEFFGTHGFTPIYPKDAGWFANHTNCVICMSRGGVNIKPSFWPN